MNTTKTRRPFGEAGKRGKSPASLTMEAPTWSSWSADAVLSRIDTKKKLQLLEGAQLIALVEELNEVGRRLVKALWNTARRATDGKQLSYKDRCQWRKQVPVHATAVMQRILLRVANLVHAHRVPLQRADGAWPRIRKDVESAAFHIKEAYGVLYKALGQGAAWEMASMTRKTLALAWNQLRPGIIPYFAKRKRIVNYLAGQVCETMILAGRPENGAPSRGRDSDPANSVCDFCAPKNPDQTLTNLEREIALPLPHPTLRHGGIGDEQAIELMGKLMDALGIEPVYERASSGTSAQRKTRRSRAMLERYREAVQVRRLDFEEP